MIKLCIWAIGGIISILRDRMENNATEYKMVIAVRQDIKLSAGKMAAQVAHAAVACALEAKKKKPKWFKEWQSEGGKKVVVKVDDENDLLLLKTESDKRDLISNVIIDAGLTVVPPGTKTVIGIGPAPSKLIDPLTGQLPLL